MLAYVNCRSREASAVSASCRRGHKVTHALREIEHFTKARGLVFATATSVTFKSTTRQIVELFYVP